MQRSRVMAIALELGRFTTQDVASVGGLPDNTVGDVLRNLSRSGWLDRTGRRMSRRLGRPAIEFAWTEEGRTAARDELRGAWPLGERSDAAPGAGSDAPLPQPSDVERDPFRASMSLVVTIIESLEEGIVEEEFAKLWTRASLELDYLQRRSRKRSAEERTLIAAMSVRLDRVREDARVEAVRGRLLTSQLELLRAVDGIRETGLNADRQPEQLERGYAIVIDASVGSGKTAAGIKSALAELSLHCFTLKVPSTSRLDGMREVLESLTGFLSTPLSSIARVFILVDRRASSWRRADQFVAWFDEADNLRESIRRSFLEMWARGAHTREAALLVGGRNVARTHDWLGQGVNKQQALWLMTAPAAHSPDAKGDTARIALNNPLLIYNAPPSEEMLGETLRFVEQRPGTDDATLRGIVFGSFQGDPVVRLSLGPDHLSSYCRPIAPSWAGQPDLDGGAPRETAVVTRTGV